MIFNKITTFYDFVFKQKKFSLQIIVFPLCMKIPKLIEMLKNRQ